MRRKVRLMGRIARSIFSILQSLFLMCIIFICLPPEICSGIYPVTSLHVSETGVNTVVKLWMKADVIETLPKISMENNIEKAQFAYPDSFHRRFLTTYLYQQRTKQPAFLQNVQMVKQKQYQYYPHGISITSRRAVVLRNLRRQQMILDYAPLRRIYKKRIEDSKSLDERIHWKFLLDSLPRDSSKVRFRRRCYITGRGRGVYREFGLCRHQIREMIRNLEIPGYMKAEW